MKAGRKARISALGRVVASRALTMMQGGPRKEVTISVGTPYCDKDGLWRCPYQIDGIGKVRIQSGKGVDSLQALLSAIEGARLSLKESDCRFSWDESKDVGSGIPIQVSTLLGPRFEERVLKAIDREQKRFFQGRLLLSKAEFRKREKHQRWFGKEIAKWETDLEGWQPGRGSSKK